MTGGYRNPIQDNVGTGDVTGPGSSTDNAITRFDGTTGKTIQNSGATIDDAGNLTANNFSGSSSGTNTGDQTSIVGITGTTAEFNTALSDGSFATGGGTASGTNTGDVTLAGTPDYITISGQTITRNAVDLIADVTGALPIVNGGSGQTTQQAAIDALTNVTAATNEYVLTKDTATGNAIFKAAASGGHTIQDEGTPLTQRDNLNFIGTGVTATDNAGTGATDITIGSALSTSYTVTNVTTDRAYDANSTTLDEIADVLGTVISDMSQYTQIGGFSSEYDNGNSGTTKTIDWSNGLNQKVTMTGNCTFTLSNPVAGATYLLKIIQDSTGGYSVTLPAAVLSQSGILNHSTAADTTDLLTLYYDGTNYFANLGKQYE